VSSRCYCSKVPDTEVYVGTGEVLAVQPRFFDGLRVGVGRKVGVGCKVFETVNQRLDRRERSSERAFLYIVGVVLHGDLD
jgi:hypothetical protein